MRKKYLSALLFGALLFASAGTFTSCKDYDDDISNLQSQVDGIKADLEDLQAQISAGKWITNVASIEGGFTVTFSDGQSFNIVNGKDGQNGQDGAAGAPGTSWEIGEDGYWYKDGEKTEYKAAIDGVEGKVNVPTIKDGIWYIVNEKGELEATEYKANGATYAVAEANGGFTIYAPTEDGKEMLEIYFPGAAGSITSMTAELRAENASETKFTINQYTFAPSDKDKKTWEDMTGTKVTTNKYILSSNDKIGLRVNPVNVNAADIDFVLINSKNEVLDGVVFTPAEYKDYVYTRAEAYGNGLYSLSMKQMEVKDKDALDALTKQFATTSGNIAYAVSADLATRAEYNIGINDLNKKTADYGNIYINKTDIDSKITVDTKKDNAVTVEYPADLYDMWLSVSSEDQNLFGIVFDQDKQTFRIDADPDILTKATFELTIHTLDNSGVYKKEVVTINVSDKIAVAPDYEKRTLNIVTDDADALKNKNAFTADMATLLNALGDTQADVWKKKVTAASVAYYTDEACTKSVTGADGIELIFVNAKGDAQAAIKDATNMKFSVDNSEASSVFVVDKEYFAKVTFKAGSSELNSIVVPFEFAIPDFANSFEQEPAVFVNNVANAYMNVEDQTADEAAYKLSRAFKKFLSGATLALDSKTKVTDKYTSEQLATISSTFDNNAMITLKDVDKAKGTNIPAGYGQELIVNASADDYMGWEYPEGEDTYSFTIKVMSPLYEGTVSAIGDVVNIPATSVSGWNMTNEHIQGKTYNNITYKVLQDKVGDWTRPEIAKVEASSTNERVVKVEGVHEATAGEKGAVNEGYIKVLPQNIAATTETTINVTVTDVWGYAKTNPVKVNVTVGE